MTKKKRSVGATITKMLPYERKYYHLMLQEQQIMESCGQQIKELQADPANRAGVSSTQTGSLIKTLHLDYARAKVRKAQVGTLLDHIHSGWDGTCIEQHCHDDVLPRLDAGIPSVHCRHHKAVEERDGHPEDHPWTERDPQRAAALLM